MLSESTSSGKTAERLSRLFKPQTVAIVGVSDDETKYSGRLLRYCRDAGMADRLRLVNPKYDQIAGLRCWKSLDALPAAPDVVVAMVGPDRIPDLITRSAGVGFIVVVGDLVRRDAPDRARGMRELVRKANDRKTRIIGPDCVGVLSPANGVAMSISSALASGPARVGEIGLISQSGGIVSSVIDRARDSYFGFSHIVSCGGEVDLDTCDYLEFMIADPMTSAISIYAEAFRDAGRFLKLAQQALAARKPIVLLKPGRSEAGANAALSHSGRIAGRRDVQSAVFRRVGVVEVTDIDDLWANTAFLGKYRTAIGGGVGAVSLSGGYTAVVGDAVSVSGARLAELSLVTVERIRTTEAQPRPVNPIDAGARPTPGREADDVVACLEALEDDPHVGATLYAETLFLGVEKIVPKLAGFAARTKKPHITCWQAGDAVANVVADLRQRDVFALKDLSQATRALGALQAYAQHKFRADVQRPGSRAAWLAECVDGPLSDDDAKKLLTEYGVPFVEERAAQNHAEAVACAVSIGFPVVLKGAIPGCLHKTEKGLVGVDLRDSGAVSQCASEMANRVPELRGFRVQKMVKGLELMVGVVSDPEYGAAIMLGFGGIFAEAMDRRAIEAIPLSDGQAQAMIDHVDRKGLLSGYRNGEHLDKAAVRRLLCAISDLMHANASRIREIDLNPVIVTPNACIAVDAVIVLR